MVIEYLIKIVLVLFFLAQVNIPQWLKVYRFETITFIFINEKAYIC